MNIWGTVIQMQNTSVSGTYRLKGNPINRRIVDLGTFSYIWRKLNHSPPDASPDMRFTLHIAYNKRTGGCCGVFTCRLNSKSIDPKPLVQDVDPKAATCTMNNNGVVHNIALKKALEAPKEVSTAVEYKIC